MKRIIKGKLYDTDTATYICYHDNGLYTSDFNYVNEELYLKKTGEFFILGKGGANSKYSDSNGNSRWGSEKIIPIDNEEARDFIEKYGSVELYISIFGEVEE